MGPGYLEFARGRDQCAEGFREFATNAGALDYSDAGHALRTWETTAIYTYAWKMTYQREQGPNHDSGTDQLVFQWGAYLKLSRPRWVKFAPLSA